MPNTELIPIIRKNGVTLYGRVIGNKGRLGQFEIYTIYSRSDPNPYATFQEAEKRFNQLDAIAEKYGTEGLRSHLQK